MNSTPTILVIFGASGDLSRRYLLPAVETLRQSGTLPEKFELVGVSRQEKPGLYQMDLDDPEAYEKFEKHLAAIEKGFCQLPGPAERIFYLSVPPSAVWSIAKYIGTSSLMKHKATKVIFDKPFGTDLESAKDLIKHIDHYLASVEVYRVDHYLAKETSRNILRFRTENAFLEKTWNKDFIEHVEVVISEKIDIEGRANFYEETGALRDMAQSHLFELAALVLMDTPQHLEEVPRERENALRKLDIVCDTKKDICAKRAQYEGYRSEVDNKESMRETFVSLEVRSSDPKWQGVPITLTTGKALKDRFALIRIRYVKEAGLETNELVFRIQPDPGIELGKLSERFENPMEAYVAVILGAIRSDKSLFVEKEEILETWRILDKIQKAWQQSPDQIVMYKKGSTVEEVMRLF